jgi:plasmid stability protein
MTSITIRDLDPELEERLRVQAARHGRAMEEEVRSILRTALAQRDTMPARLGESIGARFRPFGGVELEMPVRQPMREPPKPR